MKIFHHALGIVASMALIIVFLITSFEIGAYSDFGWYEKEYTKYDVLKKLEMDMDEVMHVTHEMMDYLRGDREDLVVNTVVAGGDREFFNEREKAHMVDVQSLFLKGLNLRVEAMAVFIMSCVILVFTKGDWKKILPKSFLIGIGMFATMAGTLAILIAVDFNKYFLLFHKLFFINDLWILYPETDLLIRMLPEGFFFDMVIRIGIIFGVMLLVLLFISIITLRKQKNKKNL